MAKTVVGLFDSYGDAQAVVRDLEGMGFDHGHLSLVTNTAAPTVAAGAPGEPVAPGAADAAATGAGAGAVAGTVIGGTVGLLAGLGTLAIPGFGPVLAAGWLASLLTGAGIGAATGAAAGGLIGALTEAGVPEAEAGYYEEGLRRGGTLVTVRCDDDEAQSVASVMNRHNVVDIDRRSEEYRETGVTGRAGYNAPVGAAAGTGGDTRTSVDNTNRGYAGVTTGSNTGFEAAESDLTTGGNPDAARSNAGMGYTGAGAPPASDRSPSGHSWTNDEEVGADADLSGAGAAVNHGYSGINTEPKTGGGYSGERQNSGQSYATNAQDRDTRYEGGSAGANAGGGRAGGYAGQNAAGSPGSTYGGPNTGVPVNPNAGVGGSEIVGESAASSAAGGAGTHGTYGQPGGATYASRQPDYNEANAREMAGVPHQEMPSRDDMRSVMPNKRVTGDADEEDLGDTDQDLEKNQPGSTNVY